jgi:hypothetical protein
MRALILAVAVIVALFAFGSCKSGGCPTCP